MTTKITSKLATKMMNGTENGSVKQFEKNNNVNSDKVESNLESVELMRNCGLWFAASIVIYLFWILNVSIAPVFFLLLLAAFFHEIKKDKLKRHSQAQITSTVDEKTLVENTFKPNDVPAWILFPDKERVEWINTILEMLWPKLGLMVREGIYGVVEPEIQKSLEQYGMTGFTFERVTLGQIPPRITGIKVYDKKSIRNQIAIDVDLLYTSDCDITISLKGWSSGLQGVRFRGTLRIELKPLISEAPLFGSIEAYFLSTPEFDFSLGGIANVFDVTGVSSLLKSIFMEILTKDMVFPNKLKLFEKDVVDELHKSDKISDQESLSNEDVHFGIRCNSCDMSPIRGMRYKCSECVKFNLCSGCLNNGIHPHHKMQSSHNRRAVPSISYPGKNVIRITYGSS